MAMMQRVIAISMKLADFGTRQAVFFWMVRPNSAVERHGLVEERERRIRERYKVHEEAERSSKKQDIPGVDSCVL